VVGGLINRRSLSVIGRTPSAKEYLDLNEETGPSGLDGGVFL
jgi:hypothetical protein